MLEEIILLIWLARPFMLEELKQAIFLLAKVKAQGQTVLTAVFQGCWEIIKDDLVKVMEEFHNHEKSCKALKCHIYLFSSEKEWSKTNFGL